jgi:hypothetical protein
MRNYLRLISSTVLLCIIFNPNPIHGQLTGTLKYEYYSPSTNYQNITQEVQTNGIVSSKGSQTAVQNSQAFTLVDAFGRYDGCQPTVNPINVPNGTAIIQRGGDCTFSVKTTRAKQYGAAGNSFIHSNLIISFFSLQFSCYHLRSTK